MIVSRLEERAEGVLEDLIRSNLVMVGKLYYNGKVKTCRVHRVIHGFCKSKASVLNLFQEIRMSEEGGFDPPLSLTPNYRRLCIHSHLFEYLFGKPNGPGIRSFLCFQKENIYVLEAKSISTIHKTFEFLKVFEFESIKFAEFPISLTRLMNLTYISLSCDRLAILPETISHLLNLQTRVVATQSPVLEIKGNIWRMIRLRHLITEAAITLPKQGEGNGGDELQTLTSLSPEYCKEDVFRKARYLKKLGIRGKLQLDHLERLKPENESLDNLYSLDPSCFPSSLTSLTISATYLDWEYMLTLGKMVHLKVLKLKNNASRGDSWKVTGDGVFLCLEFLFIGSTDLVSWEVSPHCFPRLRCLVLKNCEKLDKIPLSLAQSLETLDVQNVSESAQQSAMEINQEMVRMQRQQEARIT